MVAEKPAVRHYVLARIDPNKLVSLGLAACQPMADPVGQPLADFIMACTRRRLANSVSHRLTSGLPQTDQLVGVYSG